MKQNKELIVSINNLINKMSSNNNNSSIIQEEVDTFLLTISNYFHTCLTVDVTERNHDINLKNINTKYYFEFGISCINEGIDAHVLEIILPYISSIIKENSTLSKLELLEIRLLEKILLNIQKSDIKQYLSVINHFCSPIIYSEIYNKLSK